MKRVWMVALFVACGGDGDGGSAEACYDESACTFSTASSGGLCQVNMYCGDDEPAVYCGEEADGTFTCDCGAAVDDPPSFTSADFCNLEPEEQVCEAVAQCSNWGL